MYEAGVKANMAAVYMGKVDWSSRYADALEDHMALEVLFTPDDDDDEKNARRKAYKERGAMLMRGVDDREYFPLSSADWFGPEVSVQGYVSADLDWAVEIFKRMAKADRLAAQRPLIHNGRKYRK